MKSWFPRGTSGHGKLKKIETSGSLSLLWYKRTTCCVFASLLDVFFALTFVTWRVQHHYLSHMGDILRRRKSRGGPIHLRKRSKRSQHARNKAVRTAAGLGQGGASSSSSDSEADDEAYSKLAVLTANDNYLHGLCVLLLATKALPFASTHVAAATFDAFVVVALVAGTKPSTERALSSRSAETDS